jgi:hypothetical protein
MLHLDGIIAASQIYYFFACSKGAVAIVGANNEYVQKSLYLL